MANVERMDLKNDQKSMESI